MSASDLSCSDSPLFGDLGEGEMFRHVDAGRVVTGVLRKEVTRGECPGNAVVVATGERWLFPGRARVERTRAVAVLLGLPLRVWPGKRQDCTACRVCRECVALVRSDDMTICEAAVEMRGPVTLRTRRHRRRSGYERRLKAFLIDRSRRDDRVSMRS